MKIPTFNNLSIEKRQFHNQTTIKTKTIYFDPVKRKAFFTNNFVPLKKKKKNEEGADVFKKQVCKGQNMSNYLVKYLIQFKS